MINIGNHIEFRYLRTEENFSKKDESWLIFSIQVEKNNFSASKNINLNYSEIESLMTQFNDILKVKINTISFTNFEDDFELNIEKDYRGLYACTFQLIDFENQTEIKIGFEADHYELEQFNSSFYKLLQELF